jgi:hypothetical protein
LRRGARDTEEGIEYALADLFRDTYARISDRECDIAVAGGRVEFDDSAGWRVLHCIVDEVQKDLAQPLTIRSDGGQPFWRLDLELQTARARECGDGSTQLAEHVAEVELFQPELDAPELSPRELEYLVDEREELLGRVADRESELLERRSGLTERWISQHL